MHVPSGRTLDNQDVHNFYKYKLPTVMNVDETIWGS